MCTISLISLIILQLSSQQEGLNCCLKIIEILQIIKLKYKKKHGRCSIFYCRQDARYPVISPWWILFGRVRQLKGMPYSHFMEYNDALHFFEYKTEFCKDVARCFVCNAKAKWCLYDRLKRLPEWITQWGIQWGNEEYIERSGYRFDSRRTGLAFVNEIPEKGLTKYN